MNKDLEIKIVKEMEVWEEMIVKEMEIWEAITNSDLEEGRGHSVSLGFFTTSVLATEAAKGKGVFGTDARIDSQTRMVVVKDELGGGWTDPDRPIVFILGSPVYHSHTSIKKLKEKALAKLTNEDKKVLGLK